MAFSDNLVDLIHDKVLLSDVIGKTVNLSKKGSDFIGLCPFHNEKTPSFNVNDEDGYYHCFGCGAHGDSISFIRNFENKSFMEAIQTISDITGIKIPTNKIDNGYSIRFETAVEDQKYFKEDLQFELNSESVKGKFDGKGYIRYIKMMPQ